MQKKLYLDKQNAKLSGVCAGLAKYFDIDVTVIRILWILITFFGGSGIVAYIICAIVMPEAPEGVTEVDYTQVNDNE